MSEAKDKRAQLNSYFFLSKEYAPPQEGVNYTVEKLAYMKPWRKAQKMAEDLKAKGIKHIVEACGGLGGNTTAFGGVEVNFQSVLTYETDRSNFEIIDANLKMYKIRNRVLLLNQAFRWDEDDLLMSILHRYRGDQALLGMESDMLENTAVYIDPPWLSPDFKGEDYKSAYFKSGIRLSGKTLEEWARDIPARLIVFHLPRDYSLNLPGITIDDDTDNKARLIYFSRADLKPAVPKIYPFLPEKFPQKIPREDRRHHPSLRVNHPRGNLLSMINFLTRNYDRGLAVLFSGYSQNLKEDKTMLAYLATLFPDTYFYNSAGEDIVVEKNSNILPYKGGLKEHYSIGALDAKDEMEKKSIFIASYDQSTERPKGALWFIPYNGPFSTQVCHEVHKKDGKVTQIPNDPRLFTKQMCYYNEVYRLTSFTAVNEEYGRNLDTILEYITLNAYATRFKEVKTEDLTYFLDQVGSEYILPPSHLELKKMMIRMVDKIYKPDPPFEDVPKDLEEAQGWVAKMPHVDNAINLEPRSSDYFKEGIIKNLLNKYKITSPVLDYGCGDGLMIDMIARNRKDVYGLERHDTQKKHNYIAENKGTYKASLLYADNAFEVSKVLDEEKIRPGLITCFHVLHHIPDLDNVLDVLLNKLDNGGYLLIYDHDCVTMDQKDALTIQHDIYRQAYSEEYYYTDFMSANKLLDKIRKKPEMTLTIYQRLQYSPDYSYLALFRKA